MQDVLGISDRESAQAVCKLFDGLRLPVPETGEYRRRSLGLGPLVLVSRYGFVVRIVPEKKACALEKFENPFFVKPLFNRAAGAYRFVIDPGLNLSDVEERDCITLKKSLCKVRVAYNDMWVGNIARIPTFPDHPVVIDLDPMYLELSPPLRLSYSVRKVAELMRGAKKDPQTLLYRPLRDCLQDAWPDGVVAPDPEGIRAFKALCLDFKENKGLLRSDWEDPAKDYEGTCFEAKLYDERLRAHEARLNQGAQALRL